MLVQVAPADSLDRAGRLRRRRRRECAPPIGIGIAIEHADLAAAPAWSPATEGGVWLQLKGDAGITLNGPNISAWADQSGNSRDFSQGTGANQPAYNATGINGIPTMTCASGKSLQRAASFLTTDFDLFLVFRANSAIDAGQFSAGSTINDSTPRIIVQQNNTNSVFRTLYGGAYDNNGTFATGAAECMEVSVSGTTKTCYLNGVQGSQTTRTGSGNNVTMFLGAGFPGYSTADIGELVVFDHSLGSTARSNCTTYLRNRWGFA